MYPHSRHDVPIIYTLNPPSRPEPILMVVSRAPLFFAIPRDIVRERKTLCEMAAHDFTRRRTEQAINPKETILSVSWRTVRVWIRKEYACYLGKGRHNRLSRHCAWRKGKTIRVILCNKKTLSKVYVPPPPIILSTHLSLFIAFDAIEVCVVISVIHQAIPHDASVRVTKTNLDSRGICLSNMGKKFSSCLQGSTKICLQFDRPFRPLFSSCLPTIFYILLTDFWHCLQVSKLKPWVEVRAQPE